MADSYRNSSRDYLGRGEHLLAEGSYASMFYAAFELRCGIEGRMEEYLDVWDHIAKKKKRGWRIAELGRNVEKSFQTNNAVVRWAVSDRTTGEMIVCLYHTPVTSALQKRGEKLSNYLHSVKKYREPGDKWWETFRTELTETARQLRVANMGTLLGPPLMRKSSGQVEMNMEIPPSLDKDALVKRLLGQDLIVNISYRKALPEPVEPQAILWK
jgi:hypothetical protein